MAGNRERKAAKLDQKAPQSDITISTQASYYGEGSVSVGYGLELERGGQHEVPTGE